MGIVTGRGGYEEYLSRFGGNRDRKRRLRGNSVAIWWESGQEEVVRRNFFLNLVGIGTGRGG
jgi:hypothetical protein